MSQQQQPAPNRAQRRAAERAGIQAVNPRAEEIDDEDDEDRIDLRITEEEYQRHLEQNNNVLRLQLEKLGTAVQKQQLRIRELKEIIARNKPAAASRAEVAEDAGDASAGSA